MANKNTKFERYFIGEDLRIGKRPDGSMFWLLTGDHEPPQARDITVIEGGSAWVDEKSKTTIFSFPTKDPKILSSLQAEYLKIKESVREYSDSEYFVHLSECELREPVKNDQRDLAQINGDTDEKPDKNSGYVLDDYTFVRESDDNEGLNYVQYSGYTKEDFDEDRLGWIKVLRRLYPNRNDNELLQGLKKYFVKESRGEAWVDNENGVLVLNPVELQPPENADEYFLKHLKFRRDSYPVWNQTKYWIHAETKLERTYNDWKDIVWGECFRWWSQTSCDSPRRCLTL